MKTRKYSNQQLDMLVDLNRACFHMKDMPSASKAILKILIEEMIFDYGAVFVYNGEHDHFDVQNYIGDEKLLIPHEHELMTPEHEFVMVHQSDRGKIVHRKVQTEKGEIKSTRLIFPFSYPDKISGIVLLVTFAEIKNHERILEDSKVLGKWIGELMAKMSEIADLYKSESDIKRLSRFPSENPNPLLCCDKDGNITYLNHAMHDFMKANRLGIVKNISNLFSDGGTSYSHICRLVGADVVSKNREVRIGNRILLGSVSSYNGAEDAFVYLQDITELKNLAQEMTRKNQQLIEVKEELEYQTKRAIGANRHKSEFLANMSHELRTPLNAIIGFSEVLLDGNIAGRLNDRQEEYLQDVLESGRHLLELINDILDLSKIEAGKMSLELSAFEVSDLIRASENMMKEKALKHGIQMSVDIDDDFPTVTADERKIKQVIFNLLSNALKFTPDGGSVGIRANQEGTFAKFCVWDTGIGISIEEQQKVFGEFQQADGSSTKKYEGAGLGLAIVKKFIELHGGKVWVESKLKMGARFYFTIPVTSPKWLTQDKKPFH